MRGSSERGDGDRPGGNRVKGRYASKLKRKCEMFGSALFTADRFVTEAEKNNITAEF